MANARQIVKRRKAVRNIRKITQTMQLIATARFQACLRRATASKPYTARITEMIETLSAMEALEHPLLEAHDQGDQTLLLVITSNRGLCGSYNAGVLRTATAHQRELKRASLAPTIEMVGKKGVNYMRFVGTPLDETITDVEDKIAYARVAQMAERYMDLYQRGEVRRVEVAYTKFVSTARQTPVVEKLLPIEPPTETDDAAKAARPDFEFSPSPDKLLASLIPETVKIRLYQMFNDAIVSEQVSRMVAMKAATDAAGDMIKFLTREYNRARQSAITLELADIVGGAAAVES